MKTASALALALLALAPLAAGQTATPRQVFERARYAEQTQHDLAAAEKGYREAAAAAAKAGDGALEKEAGLALERVLERMGKRPAARQEELPASAVQILQMAYSAPPDSWETMARDLALFGPNGVEPLARMLATPMGATVGIGAQQADSNPHFAALALVRLDIPQARRALEEGMRTSTDPLVRKSIAESGKHAELLLLAAADPVPAIQQIGIRKLASTSDPRAAPIMSEAAERGNEQAFKWIARNDPRRAFALAESGKVQFRGMEGELHNALVADKDLALAEYLLQRARKSENPQLRDLARNAVRTILQHLGNRGELEDARLELARSTGDPLAIRDLAVAPEKLLPVLDDVAGAWSGPIDADLDAAIEVSFQRAARGTEAPWELVVALYKTLSAHVDFKDPGNVRGLSAIAAWIGKSTLEEPLAPRFASLWADLSSEERLWWHSTAARWAQKRVQGAGRGLPAAGAFPESYGEVAGWLIERGSSSDRTVGLFLLAGVRGVEEMELLRRMLDKLEREELPSNATIATDILARAHGSAPDRTRQEMWTRVQRAVVEKRHKAVAALTLPYVAKQAGLPLEDTLPLVLEVWRSQVADSVRLGTVRRLIEANLDAAPSGLLEQLIALFPEILNQPDNQLAALIIHVVQRSLYEPAVPLLGEALRSGNEEVRNAAQKALAEFRAQREALEELDAWLHASGEQRAAIAELRGLLASPQREVVLGAVRALGAVKARSALPELVKLLGRDDAELKQAVLQAIERMGGE